MNQQPGALQREMRQTRPFRSPSQEALVGLMRTADILRRYVSAAVEPHGITLSQYNVLRILRGAGDEGLPTLDVAERLVERTPGITRMMDRLEAKRWVRRERCPHDRRQVLCYLTSEGEELLAELDAPMDRADGAALSSLSEAEQRELIRLLDVVRAQHG